MIQNGRIKNLSARALHFVSLPFLGEFSRHIKNVKNRHCLLTSVVSSFSSTGLLALIKCSFCSKKFNSFFSLLGGFVVDPSFCLWDGDFSLLILIRECPWHRTPALRRSSPLKQFLPSYTNCNFIFYSQSNHALFLKLNKSALLV